MAQEIGTTKSEEDVHKKFHNRVKKLLHNSGFEILKSDYYDKGPDIIARTDNKKIIIQCKCAESDNKEGLNISSLIDEYSRKVDREKAERAILAISKYKIPREYLLEENKEKRAVLDKVIIWDDKIIDYYEEVVSALNEWAKYTILGDMYIYSKFGDPISAPAINIVQGTNEFFVFKISPEDLLKMSYIFRREYNPHAYQRMLNIKRLKKDIAEFLDGPEAILPTNLIGVFDTDVKFRNNRLMIPRQYKSFWIIDGQHRLYSFCYTNNQSQRSNFDLVCVGLEGNKWNESQQARLFVDVNDKSKRISKLLLYDLYELIGIREMRIELVKKLAKESKVFKDKIKLSRKDKGEISLVTFVSTNPMSRLINERNGELANLFRDNFNQNLDYGVPEKWNKSKEFYYKTLEKYFELIKDNFPKEWEDNEKYIISTDRGIRVFLRLLRYLYKYNIINGKKIGDQEIFDKAISALKGYDFSSDSLKNKFLGEGGADSFLESLKEYIQKSIPTFFPKEDKHLLHDIGIEAGEKVNANKLINDWLKLLGEEVFGELPYIDDSTLDYLENNLPVGSRIKLSVSKIHGETEFKKKCEELKNKGYDIQVNRLTKGPFQKGQDNITYFHNRWIGGNNFEIELGFDLKKDSLGAKKDRMKLFKTVNSERIVEFKERWNVLSKFRTDIFIEVIFR